MLHDELIRPELIKHLDKEVEVINSSELVPLLWSIDPDVGQASTKQRSDDCSTRTIKSVSCQEEVSRNELLTDPAQEAGQKVQRPIEYDGGSGRCADEWSEVACLDRIRRECLFEETIRRLS